MRDLWATARNELGISDVEFWRMTPRDYQALLDMAARREDARVRERIALVALQSAHLANILAPRKDKRAWQVEDFAPDIDKPIERPAPQAPQARKQPQTSEHMKNILKGLAAAHGGTIREGKRDHEEASD